MAEENISDDELTALFGEDGETEEGAGCLLKVKMDLLTHRRMGMQY